MGPKWVPFVIFPLQVRDPLAFFACKTCHVWDWGDQWVPFVYFNLHVHCEWDPFVWEPFAFLSRKTCQVWDPRPMGPICLFGLANALATGPVCLGPISIFPSQDLPGLGPKTGRSRLPVLACKHFGNGTRSPETR